MSNKKLQVFVSSTFTDLIEERQAAVQAILKAGHIPAGMELFKAGDEEQMKVIERWIDESDVYMLILGGRYGSVDEKSGKSYTQLEYEYALAQGKALFAVVVSQLVLDRWVKEFGYEKIEKYHVKELEQFRAEVLKGKVVAFWDDAKDIKLSILEALPEFQYRDNLVGWVRGDNAINNALVTEQITRLLKENEELKNKPIESNFQMYYAGLTYENLKKLLVNEIMTFNNSKLDAYSFLLKYGKNLSILFNASGFITDLKMEYNEKNRDEIKLILKTLTSFKIVDSIDSSAFKMSEDGHNFYLKALALQSEENKNQNVPL